MSFKMGTRTGLTKADLRRLVMQTLTNAVALTKEDLNNNMDKVPFDSGDLRASVVMQVEDSNVSSNGAEIFFGSNLDYATEVNNYTDGQVQHDIDPAAIGGVFDWMLEYTPERLQYNWSRAKLNKMGIP